MSRTPRWRSQERFSPAANATYASAQRRGQRSSSRSNPAVPSQSCQASSYESLTRLSRCSGESTRNSPPKDQKAWPPREASGSWSTRITRRPASASSAVATSPASPPPTTMTSVSLTKRGVLHEDRCDEPPGQVRRPFVVVHGERAVLDEDEAQGDP